jgi:hypothetical protein
MRTKVFAGTIGQQWVAAGEHMRRRTLFLSQDDAESVFLQGLHYERWYHGYPAVTFLIGLLLVCGSVRTRRLR